MSNIVQIGDKFYDFGTQNQTFVQTAYELKTLGIKNFYFMLEVKYPQLGVQDIDPYKPNITSEEIGKILIECRANPWFFFREVTRVPARGAPQPFKSYLHRASCAMVWCFMHNIDFMVCQPRQTYKTTWVLILTTYAFIFDLNKAEMPFMHLDEKNVLRNAEMFRDYICALPPYMNPWYGQTKLPGLKSIKYEQHGVSIKLLTQADSDVKAKDKLRGWTLFVGSLDEWEYIAYIADVIAGAAPAIISGRVIAEQTGGRTCMMYSSTPGDLETETGVAAQHMIDSTPAFFEGLYDMSDAEIEAFLSGATKRDDGNTPNALQPEEGMDKVTMLYIEFNYKQLRKSEAWLREQYAEAERTGKLAEYRRGVLLDRFRGGDVVLFDQKDIDYIKNHIREPDHDMFILGKFHLFVYKHEIFQGDITSDTPYFDIYAPYLIGIDVAAGGDGDNTAICIVHPYTLEVVAELQSPYIGLFDLMRIITYLAKLVPSGIFCVETNSVGKTIVDFVQETKLEHRFYHDPELNMSNNVVTTAQDETKYLEQKAKAKQYIGTYVSPAVRKNMMNLLKLHVKDHKHLLNTKYLVKDITNLVIIKKKIQAASGEHDDMVMAYLHTLYVLYFGFDLSRFNIDKARCSFKKPALAIEEYEKYVDSQVVDNMKPFEHETLYEEQLRAELTNTANVQQVSNMVGRDEYGYSSQDYLRNSNVNTLPRQESPDVTLSSSDLSFLSSVNVFY